MFFSKDLPSPTSIFTAYASMAGYMMMIRSVAHELIPAPIQDFIYSSLRSLFHRSELSLHQDQLLLAMTRNRSILVIEDIDCASLRFGTLDVIRAAEFPRVQDFSLLTIWA
ncbi:hypothetical protein HID58_089403 [Brassica napus]|uniref:Uncharacterized protein n=1 Tax=Brassica napus TaxID=3708 RepID=A0ABQ7XYW7_BRANA|nr:hypothetical protein HID58_089397 [Brassica napus]KAH0861142.1 hypothetical protein HID58_089403 [Brassica napus]